MVKNLNQKSLSDKILVNNTFYLSEKEKAQYDQFRTEHKHCGMGILTMFSPSGIGLSVSIKCMVCKAELDITDIDYW
jgi:hypothetical protein